MLNKLITILAIAVLAIGCRSAKNLPEGAPEPVRQKVLVEKMKAVENRFESIRISGSANYSKGNESQDFRLEVRILTDSLVWVDIADPFLGIKVARAVVYRDSVAFVNRLEKEYFKGNVSDLQEKLKLNFGFIQIQSILSGNLLFDLPADFDLYYVPGAYLLSDFDPDPKSENEGTERYFGKTEFRQVYVDPSTSKPVMQVQKEPALGKSSTVSFKEIKAHENGVYYPETLKIEYLESGETLEVTFDVRKVEKDDPRLNYPFNIPSDYAEMR